MKRLFLFMASGALLASPSTAQSGPVAQQSSDELVCKLTGDCAGAGATEATQDKGKSRGFSIAKPTSPNASKPAVATPAPSTAKRYGSTATTRTAQPAGRRPVAAAPTSRADLMITFVSGSATLTEQAKANAQAFVGALGSSSMNGLRFAIEGHTDAVGSREMNLDLSQRRAQAVVDYLVANGVSASRFDVRGYGFDKPINPRNPRAPSNRRVEVVKAN